MVELHVFVNNGDPDQTTHSAVSNSNLGLHCSPITLIGVYTLQWVKIFLLRFKLKRTTHRVCFVDFPAICHIRYTIGQ